MVSSPAASVSYDVLDPGAVNGLLLAASTFGAAVQSQPFLEFVRRFQHVPVVSLGHELPGATSVLVEGAGAVEALTQHLIEQHGRRRLAFIQGNNTESNERLDGFESALLKAGLELNPSLIFEGDFYADSGKNAVERLLIAHAKDPRSIEEKGLLGVDAIVAANDWMALGAMKALEAHGLRVPEDVAVVGFDDVEQARYELPSLTTVLQPTEQLGVQGVRAILSALRGSPPQPLIRLPTELVLRRSCGCFGVGRPERVLGAASSEPPRPDLPTPIALSLDSVAPAFAACLGQGWSAALIQAFQVSIESAEAQAFEAILESFISATTRLGDISAWHHVLSTLSELALTEGTNLERLKRAAALCDAGQVRVSTHIERRQGVRRVEIEGLLFNLTHLGEALRAVVSREQISQVLGERLPTVEVGACLVAVYEGDLSANSQCHVVVGYDAERGLLPIAGETFRAGELLPQSLDLERRMTWMATATRLEQQAVGYCMLEVDVVDGPRHRSIFDYVGASLHAVRLLDTMVEQVRQRERAERARLESEIALANRIQTGILPRTFDVPGLSIAASMLPATEIGGDYFDVLPVPGGGWFAIGDVSGHGLRAGVVMLMIQSIVAAITSLEPDARPSLAWQNLNQVLHQNIRHRLQQDEHATITLLRYRGQGKFDFAGAHEDILVLRTAEGKVESIATPGIWAGITSTPASEALVDSSLVLAPGDTMLLYTDGALEAAAQTGEHFGIDRLRAELLRASHLPIPALVAQLQHTILSFQTTQQDDITLVALRFLGDPTQ
jgi:DNA-binding LacI/PurR family transcriptional regulator/serine phosphatase RsbU (regulator of sigma subunit)